MAEDNLVQYDPPSSYYACRQCGTHIALSPDCIEREVSWYIIVKNPINLKIVTPENNFQTDHIILANASCSGCNKVLGKKVIQAAIPIGFLEEGKVTLISKKLQFWDGNQMLDAFTKLPLENPPGQ